jgi:hypothetical protein
MSTATLHAGTLADDVGFTAELPTLDNTRIRHF